MSIVKVVLLGLIGAAASVTLKKTNPEISMIIGIATGAIILFYAVAGLKDVVGFISAASKNYGVNTEYIAVIVKIVGITYISEFIVSALIDAGEKGIATKIEIFAKIIIVSMSIPIIVSLIQTVSTILS